MEYIVGKTKLRIKSAILFLRTLQKESELRHEDDDPFQTEIDHLKNAIVGIDAIINEAKKKTQDVYLEEIEWPREIDVRDLEAMIAATRADGREVIRISARDLWRMASDRSERMIDE
jgi:hypothetical protein